MLIDTLLGPNDHLVRPATALRAINKDAAPHRWDHGLRGRSCVICTPASSKRDRTRRIIGHLRISIGPKAIGAERLSRRRAEQRWRVVFHTSDLHRKATLAQYRRDSVHRAAFRPATFRRAAFAFDRRRFPRPPAASITGLDERVWPKPFDRPNTGLGAISRFERLLFSRQMRNSRASASPSLVFRARTSIELLRITGTRTPGLKRGEPAPTR